MPPGGAGGNRPPATRDLGGLATIAANGLLASHAALPRQPIGFAHRGHIRPVRFVKIVTGFTPRNFTVEGIAMKINLTSVYVDDQEKALRFYTDVLGFAKKDDFSNGPYRWLTVVSPEDPDGTQLQLALNDNPAAAAYQQAMFQQGQPAVMFNADDVQADYERMTARGAEFTMPPTDVTASMIATLSDTCGNLLQITQLKRW
jgi:predicted enzyme related to lactoylglutathione lyase